MRTNTVVHGGFDSECIYEGVVVLWSCRVKEEVKRVSGSVDEWRRRGSTFSFSSFFYFYFFTERVCEWVQMSLFSRGKAPVFLFFLAFNE